jgi:hypothetical protein
MTPFALLLVLVEPATALDAQSLRSEATYGLFRDPLDYIVEPGMLPRQEGHQLYTLLASQNDAGRFGAGYQGSSGKAAFGVLVDGTFSKTSEGSTDKSNSPDGSQSLTLTGWTKASAWSVLLGGAFSPSDALSVGAALQIESDAFSETIDPTTLSYGLNSTLKVNDEAVATSNGTFEQGSSTTKALAGATFGGKKSWVEVDVFFVHDSEKSSYDATSHTAAGDLVLTETIKGFDVNNPLTSNYTASGPGLKADSQIAINDAFDVRLAGSFQVASGGAATNTFKVTDSDGTDSLTQTYKLTSSEVRATVTNLLAVIEYGDDDLKLRAGVSATFSPASLSWHESYDTGAPEAPVTTWKEGLDVGSHEFALPVAVELPVHDRWILRSAARFVSSGASIESSVTQSPDDVSSNTSSSSNAFSTSSVEAALGFRFKATPRFRLDASVAGVSSCTPSGCTGAAGLVDTASLFASGVVHW